MPEPDSGVRIVKPKRGDTQVNMEIRVEGQTCTAKFSTFQALELSRNLVIAVEHIELDVKWGKRLRGSGP